MNIRHLRPPLQWCLCVLVLLHVLHQSFLLHAARYLNPEITIMTKLQFKRELMLRYLTSSSHWSTSSLHKDAGVSQTLKRSQEIIDQIAEECPDFFENDCNF